jgi:hypothetical protein
VHPIPTRGRSSLPRPRHRLPHQHTDIDPHPRADDEYSIADVASRLGVKPDVVYAWTERRCLPSRRGHGGRVWIRFPPDVEAACL